MAHVPLAVFIPVLSPDSRHLLVNLRAFRQLANSMPVVCLMRLVQVTLHDGASFDIHANKQYLESPIYVGFRASTDVSNPFPIAIATVGYGSVIPPIRLGMVVLHKFGPDHDPEVDPLGDIALAFQILGRGDFLVFLMRGNPRLSFPGKGHGRAEKQ